MDPAREPAGAKDTSLRRSFIARLLAALVVHALIKLMLRVFVVDSHLNANP